MLTAGVTRDSLVKAIFVFFADISTAASIKSEKHNTSRQCIVILF